MTPKTELIQVGELSVGFSENALPETDDLSGQSFDLYTENQYHFHFEFQDRDTLTWSRMKDGVAVESCQERYRATCPRNSIYLVDYIKKNERATSECLVIDLNRSIATSMTGTLPTEAAAKADKLERVAKGFPQTAVKVVFNHASLNEPFSPSTPKHQKTEEMIGKRVKYVYSARDAYEHIYLNPGLYTWHCLSGIEKGQADTDLCHYYKIGDELYFFVWLEKLVPTIGTVIIDFKQMKTTGKIFGYEADDFGTLSNFPIGAFAQLGSITHYE